MQCSRLLRNHFLWSLNDMVTAVFEVLDGQTGWVQTVPRYMIHSQDVCFTGVHLDFNCCEVITLASSKLASSGCEDKLQFHPLFFISFSFQDGFFFIALFFHHMVSSLCYSGPERGINLKNLFCVYRFLSQLALCVRFLYHVL